VSFWVVPWRAILLLIVIVVLLWLFARWRGKRRTEKAVKRALAAHETVQKTKAKAEAEPKEKQS
jgi:membrane protein implicated in regulation of membrane protease activity